MSPVCAAFAARLNSRKKNRLGSARRTVARNDRPPQGKGQVASRFGDQCIVVGIDYQRGPDGKLRVVSRCGQRPTDLDPLD
jgi:hypothetical protein